MKKGKSSKGKGNKTIKLNEEKKEIEENNIQAVLKKEERGGNIAGIEKENANN